MTVRRRDLYFVAALWVANVAVVYAWLYANG